MPKLAKERSAVELKRLTKRPGKHAVGGVNGLLLYVKPTLAASWVLRVMVADKRVDIGLGGYPTVSLEIARQRAREMHDQRWQGIDPRDTKRAAQDALRDSEMARHAADAKHRTFDQAAVAAHRAKSQEFKNSKHSAQWLSTITTYASPTIGTLPVDQVELPHIVSVLEPIWTTKPETASRVRQRLEAVLAWATVSGHRTGDNPARWRGNLEHVLPKSSKLRVRQHHAAVPWQDIGTFMTDLREREGMAARALEFAILTAARSGEVRLATWDEFDLDAKVWTIAAERMKARKLHRVPLSAPAIALLRALPRFEESRFVFPAARGGALSDMSLSAVTRRMNVDAVPHGFRSSFKDWCRSSTRYADEVSELSLAHVNSDATRAAYARDELLPLRTRLMNDWAKFCATLPRKGSVTPIRKRSHV
jgi:integrase